MRLQNRVESGLKNNTSSRIWIRLRFNLLLKQGQCRHPLHKCQRSENSWLIQELQCTRWVKRIWHNKKVQTPNRGYDSQVQSFEEAQIYVHHLGLFVTVQLRDETPSVLTPGTLFEDHGHSYEWVIGQKPRLTNEEKIITCKIDTSLLLFQDSGSSSSSKLPLIKRWVFNRSIRRATKGNSIWKRERPISTKTHTK